MLLTNSLTFNFDRAVTWTNGSQVPQLMEVSVTPLANPSFPGQATFVGGVQNQTVLLANTVNSVTFQLVPSYAAGLDQPVQYMAEWRQGGITGRTYTKQFAMPAQDVDFDSLESLSGYIDGTNYVQQSQVGVANGVASLNSSGQVVDSTGTPMASSSDISFVEGLVSQEALNRQNALNALNSTLSNSLAGDISSLGASTATNLSNATATLNATISSNFESLSSSITTEASTRLAGDNALTSDVNAINLTLASIQTTLTNKADLVGGYLKLTEVPPQLQVNAYSVSGQAGMLALSNTANNGSLPPVHYADIAIWQNGTVWMLLGNPNAPSSNPDPSVLSNWQNLTSVVSVNGLTGNITITPQIIGAVGTNGSFGAITQSQVTGLSATLSGYTPLPSFTSLNTTVNGILNNTNIVYLDTSGPSQGFINSAKLDKGVAYVNSFNEVTLKDGTIIASGTGSVDTVNGQPGPNVTITAASIGALAVGAQIPESQVTNLSADLSARVLSTDSRLTNARTPTAHAASHQYGGSDALLLDWTQVADQHGTGNNLPTYLAGLATNAALNVQANQVSALQSQVTYLLGGGTPTSSPIKAIWFDGTSTFSGVTNPADFQNVYHVQQKSPFGLSATTGQYYYNPAGANANEWVYPYLTPNGHLKFVQWNESNPPDTVYATQSALTALQTTVGTLATQSALSALQTQVNASATQASVNTINQWLPTGTPTTLATQAQVNALATQIGNAASQASLNQTNATVATLATSASVSALSTTVAGLATQSALATVQSQVNSNTTALSTKADLVSGTVPLNELPTNIPIANIATLQGQLNNIPTLTSGLLSTSVIPQLPISQITNLQTDLNNLCPLVNGLIPTQYLPSLTINAVHVVANEPALLAVTGAAVGDYGIITGTTAEGTYILASLPASNFTNWVLLPNPQSVSSVNGQTGAVNLTYTSVGALGATQDIPISQITSLQSTLNGLATTTALTSAVSGLQNLSQVQGTLTSSTTVKQAANYVATTQIASLAGQQSVDGVLTPIGSVVLATAQPSSLDNGLWVVAAGSWSRTTDFAMGSYFVRGSLVLVQNGSTQANTIWQESSSSGVVGSSASNSGNNNNWSLVMKAGGPTTYTNAPGITLANNAFGLNILAGGGLSINGSGQATIDTAVVARKFSATGGSTGFTAGSTICTVTHNLNTTDIGSVFIKEISSNNQVLAGCTVTGPNTITIEFANPPSAGQYRVTVIA